MERLFKGQHDDLQKELKCGEHAIFKVSVNSAVASERGEMATRRPNRTQMQLNTCGIILHICDCYYLALLLLFYSFNFLIKSPGRRTHIRSH